jgi:starch-binding outer membrane protein, SusD/RagB family
MEMKNINKMKNRVIVPFLSMTFLFSSCSLDITESDSIITKGESGIFNGVPDANGSIDNIYNGIRDQTGDQANLYALTEVSTDELLVPTRGTDWGDNGIWRTIHQHTFTPTHPYITNVWNDKNSAVLRCTEVIDPLSRATPAQLALAKFARAYNMLIVMDFWGQVPFRNPKDGADVIPSVLTRKEAYNLADLPASAPASSDKKRPAKATARFFLAKVKLNSIIYNGAYGSGDLDDVIAQVDAIKADGYSLVGGNYFDLFKGPSYTNTDVIWNVSAGAGNRMWNGLHYSQAQDGNGGGGWNGFSTLTEFYNKFQGPSDSNTIGGAQEERRGYTHTLATTNATNQGFGFGFQFGQMYGMTRDKDNKIVGPPIALKDRSGKPLAFTKNFAVSGIIGNSEVTGMRLLKYSPANGAFTEGVVMARFADAHLMKAEALLRKGNAGAALAEVNTLRTLRANTPPLTSLNETSMLDERGRELYIEGWRRNDMIRFGVFKAAKEFKPSGDGHTDLFPIPASAILSNPGLVQNPGY